MIAHFFPETLILRGPYELGPRYREGRDGPVRVPLPAPAGRQGAGFCAGLFPRRIGARRLRRALLPSGARPAGARCRRQCASHRNRGADCRLLALFRRARAVFTFALWHQRDAEDRWRGPRGAHRHAQGACRHYRYGDIRRARPQVSNLGAQPLSCGTRGGHREGPRIQSRHWEPGWRRQNRSEHGNDDGQRQQRCRWRTGPSRSRARPPRRRLARRP